VSGPSSTFITAAWIVPIAGAPIGRGWIETRGGRVRRVGAGPAPAPARDLGEAVVLPGLVNAHTHLELSWMAGRVPPASSFVDWIRGLVAVRAAMSAEEEDRRRQAVRDSIAEARRTGTVLVGDISNTLVTPALLRAAGIGGVVFHELLGFNLPNPDEVLRAGWAKADAAASLVAPSDDAAFPPLRVGVVAHAPYSVSADLLARIGRSRRANLPLSIHLAESLEELEFLRTGRGPFRSLLEDLGVWYADWPVPAVGPIEYVAQTGYLARGTLVVHAVHLKEDGLDRLRDLGAIIVTCPRSNEWVGAGMPRVAAFYGSGVPVAIGTDSLASTATLNLFDELAELRRIAPDVAAASLLDSATRVGAMALGYGDRYGTIEPGRAAAFTVVDLPGGVRDVEEYLVSGVPSTAVRPLTL
jgi:cytosine/adenosine deaminase-related metal-dependent hydrolase